MRSFGNNKFSSENICKQDQRVFVVPQRLYNLFWIDSMCLQKKKSPLKQTSDKTNSRQHRNISGSFIFGSPSPLPCRKSILSYFSPSYIFSPYCLQRKRNRRGIISEFFIPKVSSSTKKCSGPAAEI